jgi:hypothetical protein
MPHAAGVLALVVEKKWEYANPFQNHLKELKRSKLFTMSAVMLVVDNGSCTTTLNEG